MVAYTALTRLRRRETGTEWFVQAIATYREALKERTRQKLPLGWAATQLRKPHETSGQGHGCGIGYGRRNAVAECRCGGRRKAQHRLHPGRQRRVGGLERLRRHDSHAAHRQDG